jgi:hypothetical protein
MLVLALAVLSILPSSTLAQDNDYLIVPGQRVGRWELGKPLDAYGFGQPLARWEGRAQDGRPYYDGFTFLVPPRQAHLQVFTCKNDNAVFALSPWRKIDQPGETEATKYRTAEGIAIDSREDDILAMLGRPGGIGEWTERHGSVEVNVKQLSYPGLRILVNKADQKVFAVGATTSGAFRACLEGVFGRPSVAQPAPASSPAPVPVTVSLPVPMPAGLRIVLPGPDTPPNRAAFSGVWVGKWDNILDTALAVREITSIGVSAVYAWGVASTWMITRAGYTETTGRFAGPGELHVQAGTLVIYRMRSDGKLDAVFGTGPRTIMTKVFPQ